MISVLGVPSREVDAWWEQLKPHLERFERETQRTDAETIRRQAKERERQIWAVSRDMVVIAVAVTEIYELASGRVCWIWVAAGDVPDPDDMRSVYQRIEDWARSIGCTSIGINGRKGWLRVLPGFKQTAIVIEKDLRDVGKH